MLALHPSANGAIQVSGAFNINTPNCDVDANSTSPNAVTLSGAGNLTASHLNVVGNYTRSFAVTVNATIRTGAAVTPDPYASLTVPSFSGCDQTNYTLSGSNTAILNPGVYCGGITVSGAANLTMNPGVHIMNHGSFQVSGAVNLTGSGVSIVLTSTTGAWGTVNVTGASNFSLTAPSSGPMQGIAMFVDRAAPNNNVAVRGASNQHITGALYFPTQAVTYSGAANVGGCEQLVASTITIVGAGNFGRDCPSLDVPGFRAKGVPAE